MSARVFQLYPEMDHLLRVTSAPQSLAVLYTEACSIANNAGPHWQLMYTQLQGLQESPTTSTLQKLQLASCERHFLGYYGGYQQCEQHCLLGISMISPEHTQASLNLLATSSKCCASAGNFEQAFAILSLAFRWASQYALATELWPIYSAAVVICNRIKAHGRALRLSKHALLLAELRGNQTEQQLSCLKVLNSKRLMKSTQTQFSYNQQISLLEHGVLQYDSINQFLLVVHSALESLDLAQPDCLSAARALAIAQELALDANDYSLASYLLAVSRYHLAYGRRQKARDAILEAEYLMPESDPALNNAIHQTLKDLGVDFCRREQNTRSVTASTWSDFLQQSDNAIDNFQLEPMRSSCPA